jgi:hypothetical protein
MKSIYFFTLSILIFSPLTHAEFCDSGFESFERNVYPVLRKNCIECHAEQGPGIGHSVANSKDAYEIAKSLSVFPNVNESDFIQKVRTQHWRKYNPAAIGTTVEVMREALERWWIEGEIDCVSNNEFISAKLDLPQFLPVFPSEKFLSMSWDLGKDDNRLSGVEFSVDIQVFSAPNNLDQGSFRLVNPRIKSTPGVFVHLEGISFLISGVKESSANLYSDIKTQIYSERFLTLSLEHMIVPYKDHASPTLQVSFRKIGKAGSRRACKELSQFEAAIKPMFDSKNCIACHAGGSASFEMPSDPVELCADILSRNTFPALPEKSPVLGFIQQGKKGHPKLLNSGEAKTLIQWLMKEGQ